MRMDVRANWLVRDFALCPPKSGQTYQSFFAAPKYWTAMPLCVLDVKLVGHRSDDTGCVCGCVCACVCSECSPIGFRRPHTVAYGKVHATQQKLVVKFLHTAWRVLSIRFSSDVFIYVSLIFRSDEGAASKWHILRILSKGGKHAVNNHSTNVMNVPHVTRTSHITYHTYMRARTHTQQKTASDILCQHGYK